ncbi:MAG: hypothetical protein Q7T33_02820 [Dehalococcoidia bacterium]|nr:hypothetical protein [Dehalococcoidia bacterium]
MEPRDLAQAAERSQMRPGDIRERFSGYGVMGLPFASGHILGLRRFPASSVGPGYTSVWHRDPAGAWTFYSTVEPLLSCNRYFGKAVERFQQAEIGINWTGPRTFSVSILAARLDWDVEVAPTPVTRIMNAMGRLIPEAMWQKGPVLTAMSTLASLTLRAGRLRLQGTAPNGQHFIANPRLIWVIPRSRATVGGADFGTLGPAPRQATLADFRIPQRGMFVVGGAFFEPFAAARHSAAATRSG